MKQTTDSVSKVTSLLAVVFGVAPIYLLGIWSHLSRDTPYQLFQLLAYPMVFGSLILVWIYFLLTVICKEKLSALVVGPGSAGGDVILGLLVFLGFVILSQACRLILPHLLPPSRAPQEFHALIEGLRNHLWVRLLWFGPVVWIGVAAFEEITRIFFLNRLRAVWPGGKAGWIMVIVSALLIGGAHIYQGWYGVVSIGLQSLAAGWFYLWRGRVWPLIVGHALYDTWSLGSVLF